jgi:hypothetical protein
MESAEADELPLSPYSFTLPTEFGGTVDDMIWPYVAHLRLTYDGHRVRCANLTCLQRSGGPPVTAEGMTRMPVAELVFLVANWWARERPRMRAEMDAFITGRPAAVGAGDLVPPMPPGRQGPSDDHLRALGLIYTLAYACGGSPRREVMLEMSLSRTTANRWISAARERGWIQTPLPR